MTSETLDDASASRAPETIGILALDQALARLAAFDERKAKILEMKYFAGMTEAEVAGALNISERTLRRDLRLAKAWLAQHLA